MSFVADDCVFANSLVDRIVFIGHRARRGALRIAGIAGAHAAETLALATWDDLYSINVGGVFLSCRLP
ncbi:hypothetical protein [Mesorhizobium sp. M0579]|uniref:hypothetical protein n=1 Tax=Mesorhizobium sp. M0579 TaxID=2956962 RepID=UPI0033393AB8